MTETFLEMAKRHRKMDMLRQGDFDMQDGKACSVGCLNHDYGNEPDDFAALSQSTGYPEWAHHLQEVVFEGLPESQARDWHVDFAAACEKCGDWDAALYRVLRGILQVALPHDASGSVQQVIDLLERGKSVSRDEWLCAEQDAGAAAGAAAWAAWDAARAAGRDATGDATGGAAEAAWDVGATWDVWPSIAKNTVNAIAADQ